MLEDNSSLHNLGHDMCDLLLGINFHNFYSYANASDYGWVWSVNRGWPLSWAVEMHAGVLEFPLPAFYPFNFQALNFSLDLVFWGIVLLLPSSLYLYQKSSQSVHMVSALRSPRTLVGILAVASVVLVLDIPIAFLIRSYISVPLGIWTPYLANGTDYRPTKGIFSDLLFLEGIVALAIGLSAIGAGVYQ